jgi:ABC-type nitrate/sulfonate/bicarbonate transport system ATPase subunit
MAEPDRMIGVHGLSYWRPNGLAVLADIELEVGAGEIVSVVGPSGCGKSTLLSLLAGLLTPTSGTVERSDPGASSGQSRWLTLMFQEETLLPWRSVERNVSFGLERLGLPRDERAGRTRQLLSMVGLADFARTLPTELSGGMRRRAQFAACVAPYPRVLLLDEPFSALDEPTRVSLHADVLRVVRELDIAVVLVTHDIAEAITLADRVIVLSPRPGRIAGVLPVPLGRDRDVLTVRETERYGELYAALWRMVWHTTATPSGGELSPASDQRAAGR